MISAILLFNLDIFESNGESGHRHFIRYHQIFERGYFEHTYEMDESAGVPNHGPPRTLDEIRQTPK